MDLLVHELGITSVETKQQIEIGGDDILLEAIRPWLYKHNSPAGSLRLVIKDESEVVTVATSETIAISAISVADFFHGAVRFLVDAGLTKNTKYWVILEGISGYAFAEAAYIGWNGDFDLKIVDRNYANNEGFNSALLMELWERKTIKRG